MFKKIFVLILLTFCLGISLIGDSQIVEYTNNNPFIEIKPFSDEPLKQTLSSQVPEKEFVDKMFKRATPYNTGLNTIQQMKKDIDLSIYCLKSAYVRMYIGQIVEGKHLILYINDDLLETFLQRHSDGILRIDQFQRVSKNSNISNDLQEQKNQLLLEYKSLKYRSKMFKDLLIALENGNYDLAQWKESFTNLATLMAN